MPERITPEQLAEIEGYTDAATGPRLLVGHKSWAGDNTVLTEEGHPVAVFGHGDVAETDSKFFARARADVPKLIAEVKASHAETVATAMTLDRARELHSEWRIYDECGHRHTFAEVDAEEIGIINLGLIEIEDVGLVCRDGYTHSICRQCCTDGDGHQTLACVESHDNGTCFPCKTRCVLDGEVVAP